MKSTRRSSRMAFCTANVTFHSTESPLEYEVPTETLSSREPRSLPLAPDVAHELEPS